MDTWSAGWDQADVADLQVAGNDTKKYANLVVRRHRVHLAADRRHGDDDLPHGPLDAGCRRQRRHLPRSSWWTSAPNGTFGGGDDVEHEVAVTAASTPPLATGRWIGIDIPFVGVHRPHDAGPPGPDDPGRRPQDRLHRQRVLLQRRARRRHRRSPAPTPTYAAARRDLALQQRLPEPWRSTRGRPTGTRPT